MKYKPHHTAISVRNLEKSLAFYDLLGFKQIHRYDDSDKVGIKMKLGDYVLEIFAYKQNQDKPALTYELGNNLSNIGVKHFGLTTDDVDAALADLRKKGLADETTKILTKGTARFFFIKDPDGMWVEVIKDDRYEQS